MKIINIEIGSSDRNKPLSQNHLFKLLADLQHLSEAADRQDIFFLYFLGIDISLQHLLNTCLLFWSVRFIAHTWQMR